MCTKALMWTSLPLPCDLVRNDHRLKIPLAKRWRSKAGRVPSLPLPRWGGGNFQMNKALPGSHLIWAFVDAQFLLKQQQTPPYPKLTSENWSMSWLRSQKNGRRVMNGTQICWVLLLRFKYKTVFLLHITLLIAKQIFFEKQVPIDVSLEKDLCSPCRKL